MLNQSLNLRIGQQLSMTPQLQQAIRMLQLSTIELQEEVQEILESNPLLEEGEGKRVESRPKAALQKKRLKPPTLLRQKVNRKFLMS